MDNNTKKKKDYSNLISYLDTNNLKTDDTVVTDTVVTDNTVANKIDCLLKDINNKFDESPCNDVSFTGLNYIDELHSINDPNIFQYIDIFNYKSINNSINKGFTVKIATTPQNEFSNVSIISLACSQWFSVIIFPLPMQISNQLFLLWVSTIGKFKFSTILLSFTTLNGLLFISLFFTILC